MNVTSASDTALIVIAAATTLQALMLVGGAVGAWLWWRRVRADLDQTYHRLAGQVERTLAASERAAEGVEQLTLQTSTMVGKAGAAVGPLVTAVAGGRALMAVGAASAARGLGRWLGSRRSSNADTGPASRSR